MMRTGGKLGVMIVLLLGGSRACKVDWWRTRLLHSAVGCVACRSFKEVRRVFLEKKLRQQETSEK